jgi:hypothetical protein
MFSHSSEGVMLGDQRLQEVFDVTESKDFPQYGVRIVDFGFVPGSREVVWYSFAQDIRSYITTDRYGTTFDNLPMMADINDGSAITLVFQAGAGGSPFCIEAVIGSHVNDYGKQYILVGEPETIVYAANYYSTGKVTGFLPGATGGLQYEGLTGLPGISAQFGTASILISLTVIISMVAMNIRTLITKKEAS